jgi:putative membrane protein
MSERTRRPAVFRFDDPAVVAAVPVVVPLAEPTSPPEAKNRADRPPWAAIFWIGVFGLAVLATGLAVVNLIEDLASRAAWLGGAGLVLAVAAGVALCAIIAREAIGLARLGAIESLHNRAVAILASDERTAGRALVRDLLALTKRMPRLARPRARLQGHLDDIIDGGDLIRLAERELMAPLDEEARRLVTSAAKRVSVVTAVSPRAAIDVFFVLVTALGLVRRLALLYGGRPGTIGLIALMRHAVSHLALTGGMAASDSLIQQVIGHGLAAKLSARLGEGVLNGLLTARLGLAAIEVIRPLPFNALRQPSLNDLAGSLLRLGEERPEEVKAVAG